MRSLSGGERSRLELALLGIMPSNLLLLDEPTNHLDIPAREAIEAFLRETPATVLVVSHDRRLLETICDRLWVVADGLAAPFDGGYRAWRAAVADGWTVGQAVEAEARRLRIGSSRPSAEPYVSTAAATRATNGRAGRGKAQSAATSRSGPPGSRDTLAGTAVAAVAVAPASRAARPARLSKDAYRRQKTAAEADLTRLGLRKNHLELAMGDPAVQANFVEIRRITSELADVRAGPDSGRGGVARA